MSLASVFEQINEKVESQQKQTLANWLFEGLGSKRPIPPYTYETRLSASKLHDLCPRFETLRAEHQITVYDEVPGTLQWVFNVGKLYHSMYRNWYLGPRGMYYGRWRCLRCGWNTDGDGTDDELGENGDPTMSFLPDGPFPNQRPIRMVPMPEVCGGCGAPRMDTDYTVSGRVVDGDQSIIAFEEWPMVNEEFGIHAKSDGWRRTVSGMKLVNQEIKSCSWTAYQKVRREGAQDKHKTQSQICTWMSGMDEGEVVYLNKGAWKDPDDFVLVVSVPLDMAWLDTYVFKPITVMRDCLKSGTLAPRICASTTMPRAKECELSELCFEKGTR